MTKNNHRLRFGFSLLEVVVALAMLALIAVPAVGLATMAVSRSKEQLTSGKASELKTKVDIALRAYGDDAVFGDSFIPVSGALDFVASEDLQYIELGSGTLNDDNDQFYLIRVREPAGYDYLDSRDSYRILVYEVVWPNNSTDPNRSQLFFSTVFRK